MTTLRTIRNEIAAVVKTAVATPFGGMTCPDVHGYSDGRNVPVVFVHGLLGGRANFWTLRDHLTARGFRDFTTFSYAPRVDFQRLAPRLGEHIAGVRRETGAERVDVVGHSLGGLVARQLIDMYGSREVRRLVTLASPYYGERFPSRELAIFASDDMLIAPPARTVMRANVTVVPECGHVGILSHPLALDRAAHHLRAPLRSVSKADAA
jgi:pimeloyl-ACP methyl ester carboxylesterase